jgi:[protein-PII] uridylyltransferase
MNRTLFDALHNRRAIIDRKAVAARLDVQLADMRDPATMRAQVVKTLKVALSAGREELLTRLRKEDQGGPACARGHAFLIDQIIRLLFDAVTSRIYPMVNPTMAERLCLVAVGGYGRGELAPHSDVDLLFLTPYKQTSWGEQVIEAMLYALWDLRLKVGHASRSLDDMVRMGREDLTVRTALLESRYLWGDQDLYDEAGRRFFAEVVSGTGAQFVTDKLAEREARHKRMGDSRYVVEPNLKEGKGGLRDLHALFWIGKYLHRVRSADELVDAGLFTAEELRSFRKAETFLWTVRCHLHDLTGRAEERLTFDVQRELAARLGYADRPGARGVERFMKHYFLTAKQVGSITGQFLAHLEELHRKKPLFRMPSLTRRPRDLNGFRVDGNRLSIPKDDFFRADPVRLIELFQLADAHSLEIHPTAMRQAARDVTAITAAVRNDPRANALFLDLLTSTKSNEELLRAMNEAGVFGRFVPDFGRVVAQMQYDMYHHYTVDEHSIRALGLLARIERGDLKDDHPLSSEVIHAIASRRVLYVAVLLHDIAKGRGGDHSIVGAEIALKLCPRLGLTAAETETVSWLVRYHLLMSATAFKRDLSDYKTILDFAETVQSPERLRLLLVLTIVDIRAVGPGVWNSWKGQLLRTLYEAASEVLIAGHKQSGRRERIAAKQDALALVLGWPADRFDWYARRFFDSYWIAEPHDTLLLNAEMIRHADAEKRQLAVAHGLDAARGATLVSVYTGDHPGLFSRLAGAVSLAGANILDAKVHTTRDGMALDNFVIQDQTGAPFADPERLQRLRTTIEDALSARIRLSEKLAAKPLTKPRAAAFAVAPAVFVDNALSNRFTVIEVNALDRPALLFSLTYALYQSKVTIHSAHIATYGERAVDTFYVTDLTGDKISNANRLRALERRLIAAVTGEKEEDEPAATRSRTMQAAE